MFHIDPTLFFLNKIVCRSLVKDYYCEIGLKIIFNNSKHRILGYRFFRGCQSYIFSLYIKTNNVFRISKHSCIRINKNIIGIKRLFCWKIETQDPHLYNKIVIDWYIFKYLYYLEEIFKKTMKNRITLMMIS